MSRFPRFLDDEEPLSRVIGGSNHPHRVSLVRPHDAPPDAAKALIA